MGGVLAGLAPDHFLRVEFGTVLGQVVRPQFAPQSSNRTSRSLRLVVRNVVQDEADLAEAFYELDQERLEGAPVEVFGAAIDQSWASGHGDGAVVLGAPLAGFVKDGEADAAFGPASPRRSFLLEAGFVLEDDGGSPSLGFFLMMGSVFSSQRF